MLQFFVVLLAHVALRAAVFLTRSQTKKRCLLDSLVQTAAARLRRSWHECGGHDSPAVLPCPVAAVVAADDPVAGAAVPVDGAAEAQPQQADEPDDVRSGHPTGSHLVEASSGRSIHPQPADIDGGLRKTEGSGFGTTG